MKVCMWRPELSLWLCSLGTVQLVFMKKCLSLSRTQGSSLRLGQLAIPGTWGILLSLPPRHGIISIHHHAQLFTGARDWTQVSCLHDKHFADWVISPTLVHFTFVTDGTCSFVWQTWIKIYWGCYILVTLLAWLRWVMSKQPLTLDSVPSSCPSSRVGGPGSIGSTTRRSAWGLWTEGGHWDQQVCGVLGSYTDCAFVRMKQEHHFSLWVAAHDFFNLGHKVLAHKYLLSCFGPNYLKLLGNSFYKGTVETLMKHSAWEVKLSGNPRWQASWGREVGSPLYQTLISGQSQNNTEI